MRSYGVENSENNTFGGPVGGFSGAAATEHYLSAQAAMDLLKMGGNAFDAAAAATLVESVVNPHMFTVGGECPMLLYVEREDRVISVNGNTQAPGKARLETYRERGLELIPPEGVLSAGVPAAFSALLEVLVRYGSLPFEEISRAAVELAEAGFPLHPGLLEMPRFSLTANREKFLRQWPETARLYLTANGNLPPVGSRLRNTPFANLLKSLVEVERRCQKDGPQAALSAVRDYFYRGDPAREIEKFVQERGGYLEMKDLADFRTFLEKPASVSFRDATVFKCGPWSQGPVLLQHLKLLEGFDLEGMGHNSPDYLHIWTEAAKLVYADREQYYADPGFTPVPLEALLSEDYAVLRRGLIDMGKADGNLRPGAPHLRKALLAADEVFLQTGWGFGTVHVAVADKHGNLSALTPSGGWLMGNEVIPSLGFPLTSRLQTFYLDPRHPNALAPGKRPRTTLSPSLAFRKGRPWMAFGTMGGDQQDQWLCQFFLNRVLFDMSLQEAIEAPKVTSDHFPGTFHPHNAFPRSLSVEVRIGTSVRDALRRRGHVVKDSDAWSAGYLCAVARNESGLLEAGSDPRGRKGSVFPSCALAW